MKYALHHLGLSNMLPIVSFRKLLKIIHQSSEDGLNLWKCMDWILAQSHKKVLKLLPKLRHITSAKKERGKKKKLRLMLQIMFPEINCYFIYLFYFFSFTLNHVNAMLLG